MKVLFIVPYPTEGASNRFRVEQYLSYLQSKGIRYKVRPFISKGFYNIIYRKKYYLAKIFYFAISTLKRLFDLMFSIRYDLILIHREAYPIGPAFFEYILSKLKRKIIFDFDDAIFLPTISRPNSYIERFKRPDKISEIIGLSEHVIAGNSYLRDFAKKFNKHITIIPTCINTETYKPNETEFKNDKVTIGWIGSFTTCDFLYSLENVFKILSAKYTDIQFKIVGGNFKIEGLSNIINQPWSLEREIEDLQSFDIGIMPMPDNEWTKGKCGFKAILYMSVGIPVVCSPVGVNSEIVQDGLNGFLASTEEQWIEKLSLLIESGDLRRSIGAAGRKTAEERFSLQVNAPKILRILRDVYGGLRQ